MNCEKSRERFPDELAGSLPPEARADLVAHLEKCAACRGELESLEGIWTKMSLLPELEPSAAADTRFSTLLQGYRAGLDHGKSEARPRSGVSDWVGNWWPLKPAWQFALVMLLFSGGVLAGWGLRHSESGKAGEQDRQLVELRHEVLSLKEQMALALLEQKSAGERLLGVEWTSRLEEPDAQVLSALVRALDSDPNVNVRLAAIGALQPFARQAEVKKALLASLPRQESPLVQIELIHLLVEKEERESTPVLKSLTEDREIDESVRERARWGLSQLGV